jgi:hypothetical protein
MNLRSFRQNRIWSTPLCHPPQARRIICAAANASHAAVYSFSAGPLGAPSLKSCRADAIIDALLQSPNVDLLKRYRNCTFHFQKDYNDERFLAFMRGDNAVMWVRSLNAQFARYFLDRFRAGSPSPITSS